MAKRMKHANRGNLEASAPTQKEANQKLDEKIDRALAGSYDPMVKIYQGWVLVVTRAPEGWTYALLNPQADHTTLRTIYQTNCRPTQEQAIVDGLSHLYQNALNLAAIFEDNEIPFDLKCRDARSNLITLGRFYRACKYREAQASEGDDQEAFRRWGLDHSNDPAFRDRGLYQTLIETGSVPALLKVDFGSQAVAVEVTSVTDDTYSASRDRQRGG